MAQRLPKMWLYLARNKAQTVSTNVLARSEVEAKWAAVEALKAHGISFADVRVLPQHPVRS